MSLIGVRVSADAAAREAPRTGTGLDALPFPGTPDASPRTSIDFPALAPGQLDSVTVTGSRSGRHSGRLRALPAHGGTTFVPTWPFVTGDHVSVHAILSSPAAGTASGAPDARRVDFVFAVATRLSVPSIPSANDATTTAPPWATLSLGNTIRHDLRETNTWTHTFHSEGWLHPPIVWMSGKDPDPNASGDVFASVQRTYVQAGPIILDPSGQLIWFNPLPNRAAAFNVTVQRYQGQSVLTYWQGYTSNGYGSGDDVILNHAYQTIATVRAGNGLNADVHEFQITPQGTAFITAYEPVRADLSSHGGWRNGINSVQPLPNGNLLVSARHTWALYEIDPRTGKIPLVIGGKHSSFKIGRGANFEWQHDATMLSDGTITLFDDADGYTKSESQSRALRLSLDYKTGWVTLVHAYTNNPSVLAMSQGSVQVLPDGNTFVGWGSIPYFTEFSKFGSGRQLFSLHYQSYRGYRFPWWGQPATPPDVSATATAQGATVYAAWNGATDVASWRVLAGPSPMAMTTVAQFPKTFFETTMSVHTTEAYLAAQALGNAGQILGTSGAVGR